MKFVVSRKKEDLAEKSGSGGFIGRSGIYPVKIDFVSLEQSEKGAVSFNINCTYNGNKSTIYGNTIANTDGNVNEIGWNLLNKLLVIAGCTDGYELTTETQTHSVGKDNIEKEFNVVPELCDIDCQIQVKEVFSRYKGEITQTREIYNFFTEDGATADELNAFENDRTVKKGEQLAKILAKDATIKPLLRENKGTKEAAPTQEEVDAWLAAKATGKPAPKPKAATAPKGNLFSKK